MIIIISSVIETVTYSPLQQ